MDQRGPGGECQVNSRIVYRGGTNPCCCLREKDVPSDANLHCLHRIGLAFVLADFICGWVAIVRSTIVTF